jgi:EAL domain-containing protein (putative c-di-GMP-specific phosphodiesterase class I)
MYHAKAELTEIELYHDARDNGLPDRISLTAELPGAIERGEFVLYFQPQVDILSGEPVAAEALVRWIHPERGLIPPDRFIPLAETSGAIAELTRWVVGAALAEQARWRAAGHDIPVAVNFSGPNVLDVDMPAAVASLLEEWETPRGGLIVEISERTVMHGPSRLSGLLEQLREIGAQSSLDDFGTGQSSLAFVRSLPVDEIKIDRSFVFEMLRNPADEAIAGSTISLGRALGLRVVAEGIEDEATRQALAADGCHVAQGYLISKPLPGDDFAAWLSEQGAAAPLPAEA